MSKDKETFGNLIRCHQKRLNIATHPLAKILRKILMSRITTSKQWDQMLDQYLKSQSSYDPSASSTLGQSKARIHGQLADPDKMTWKVLMMAIRILRPTKLKFTMELTWSDGTSTMADTEVTFGGSASNDD